MGSRSLFLSVVIFISVLYGCSSQPVYLVNLSFVKDAIIRYHESGDFHRDAERSVNEAIAQFDKITPSEKSAVVFDVDETALSNYEYNKNCDFGYVPEYFDMWIDSAKAPPVIEVLNLYNYLVDKNFRVIFLTARKENQFNATYKNLVSAGFTKFDTLIVKDKNYSGISSERFKSEKRTQLKEKGYKIEGTVGDQWSDLNGAYHGIQVKIPDFQYFIR